MNPEPHIILRCPGASAFLYAMPTGESPKIWVASSLSQILGLPQVQMETGHLGKPRLPQGMGFANWSNSQGQCVLAYSEECEVGVDLEFYRNKNFEAISKRFFAPSEATSKAEVFYIHWTKKEAYYKCMGGNFFSVLKSDLYPDAKIWNLQGPYMAKHELALCMKNK
jgi:phosphopantetheinyl transferase